MEIRSTDGYGGLTVQQTERAHNLLNFYKFNFSIISGEWTEGLKSNRQCCNGEW